MGYLAIVSRGLRWNLLASPPWATILRPSRSVHAVAFSYFANAFVPRSGEVARCAALNQTDDIPVDQLLGTVITERVVDFLDACLGSWRSPSGDQPRTPFWLLMQEGPAARDSASLDDVGRYRLVSRALRDPVFWMVATAGTLGPAGQNGRVSFKASAQGIRECARHGKARQLFLFHTIFIWVMYFLMSYVLCSRPSRPSSAHGIDRRRASSWWRVDLAWCCPHPAASDPTIGPSPSASRPSDSVGDVGFAVANVVWLTQTADDRGSQVAWATSCCSSTACNVAEKGAYTSAMSVVASPGEVLAKGPRLAKVVFTNGVFDVLHVGHVAKCLKSAASHGQKLVVGVNSDASVRAIGKGSRPSIEPWRRQPNARVLGCPPLCRCSGAF